MSPRAKFHLIFSLCVLALASVVSWLLAGETSPLADYFSDSVLLNFWRGMHLLPYLFSIGFGGGHAGSDTAFYVAFIIQWLVIGLILSFIVLRFRSKPAQSPSILK